MSILDWFKRDAKEEVIEPIIPRHTETRPPETADIGGQRCVSLSDVDDLFISAGQFVISKDRFKTTDLQRQFRIGNTRANKLFDELVSAGVVEKHFGSSSNPESGLSFYGTPCMTQDEWARYLQGCVSFSETGTAQNREPPAAEPDTRIDSLTGEEFEVFCAKLLAKSGYSQIKLTSATGDRGVDITASKDGVHYAFQCKRYTGGVGNAAVQEVYSGKSLYDADVAVVITNSYFTEQAKDDAERLRVRLWDRSKLLAMQRAAGLR